MATTYSADPKNYFSPFINLYDQLNSNNYPIKSKVFERLDCYLEKILSNKIDEKLLYEFAQLNKLWLLINSPKVKLSELDLLKWISGRPYRFDANNDDYARNLFFEADFALRFVKSEIDFKCIDLNCEKIEDECDIVIDEKIIVECKNISSEKKILERIKKANKQLTLRLQHIQTDAAGIIAIDITQIIQANVSVFSKEKLFPILEENNLIYKLMDNSADPEVIKIIHKNCSNFFNEQLEKLNITVDTLKNLQISQDIYSIMIQSEIIIIIDKVNERDSVVEELPIFGRVMTVFKNPLYKGKVKFPSNFHKSLQHQF